MARALGKCVLCDRQDRVCEHTDLCHRCCPVFCTMTDQPVRKENR
jgi:hypothetical protein